MLQTRRPAWVLLAHSGLWCALASLAFGPPAARATEPAAYAPASPGGEDPEGEADVAYVDQRIAEIDALLAKAHFRTALGLARRTLKRLDLLADPSRPDGRRARLELMAATAEVALGQRAQAERSLVRALRADPSLVLDERQVSPKVVELWQAARRSSGIEEVKP